MIALFLLPGLLMAAPAMGDMPDSSDAARIHHGAAFGRKVDLRRPVVPA
ncbi:hypothetical protein [Novosphingobium terrae]|nr:hypothetical protein [Novosphingobium terrae]